MAVVLHKVTEEEEEEADGQLLRCFPASLPPAVHDGRCNGETRCGASCCFAPTSSGLPVMVQRGNAGRGASHDRYGRHGASRA